MPVRNCWHFCSDGNSTDILFDGVMEFTDGMNRIFLTLQGFQVTILAFCLMDTHFHFILHGEFDECNHFIHEYTRRTSMHIARIRGEREKLSRLLITHQEITTDIYLKTAICYTLRNAQVAGLKYMAYDYPWSSASLMFRSSGHWTSPDSSRRLIQASEYPVEQLREILHTREIPKCGFHLIEGLVYPADYVDITVAESIFRTHRAFSFFMGQAKESEVESIGGIVSNLSIPINEMMQHRDELCQSLYGTTKIRSLDTMQRLRLARQLRHRFKCSAKQIIRVCCLSKDALHLL